MNCSWSIPACVNAAEYRRPYVPNNAAIAPETSSPAAGATCPTDTAASAAAPTCDPMPANCRAAASTTPGDTKTKDISSPA
jgi:hypothetical protein